MDAAPFLERDEELAALWQTLRSVERERRGRVALVAGEAGVGKSELLRRFREQAERSARFLWAACEPLHTPRPLGPLLDIAEVVGGELEAKVAAGAAPHDVAVTILRELAGQRPTVMVMEDVHWADEATLDVLRLVMRRVERVPALIVTSLRHEQMGRTHPLRLLLGELPRSRFVTRLDIACLSRDAVTALATPAAVDPDVLYARTGGNPFFVTEAIAAATDGVPETVRDAVLARAARLSEPARALIDAVAVIPHSTEVWLLETLAEVPPACLEECLASGMLKPAGDAVAFRHELARLAVQESLPPDRKVALNRRALAGLLAAPDGVRDLARLAHHAEEAGDADAVCRYAPAAASRAAVLGAHREAAAQYERALRFSDGMPADERADIFECHWRECFVTGLYEDAIVSLQRGLAHHRAAADRLKEGDLLRALSQTVWCAGGARASKDGALAAVTLLESLPMGAELARAYAHLAAVFNDDDDRDPAIAWGERALELAERLQDRETMLHALATVGAVQLDAGDPQGEEKLRLALATAKREALHEQAGRTYTLAAAATVRRRAGTLARGYVHDGRAYCSDHGLELYRLYLLAYQARLDFDQGRWNEAVEGAIAVLRVPRPSTVPRINALVILGLSRARRGDPEHLPPLEEAMALAEPTGELQRIGPAAAALAEARWLAGDEQGVHDITAAALELALQRRSAWMAGELADWRRRVGIVEPVPDVAAPPYAAHLAGDPARAAELWTELGCPYEAALARAEADEEPSVRQGLEVLHRLGARQTAAVIARQQRRRGARRLPRGPRQSARANAPGLTARQLDVLVLLAQGLRNADIADRLFLSEKTVDHHVSAILRKRDAPNRGHAAATALRLGLLEGAGA